MGPDLFVVLLAGVVHAMLQLGIGTLLILYHASLGKHITLRTRSLVTNYIFGNALLTGLSVSAAGFIIYIICRGEMNPAMLTIVMGVLIALAVSVWTFYYRRGKSTELWLPKSVARYINKRANVTESNTEAFGLGMLACFAEAPFTIILVLVAGNSIVALPQALQILAIAVYTFLSILPLFVMRIAVRKGQTIVDVQKWRIRNKNFLRVLAGIGFLVLAVFLLAFKILKAA
ncbi:hypothetical protein IKD60_03000 [Candidatus Saccharibacteria bacterium]|nr:hypothetical protein [Candidatus Saccharibacteria bacterium]MBR3386462.1 hypothetical protein [Candidatus Saccharibacteria bacterium]